MAFDYTNPGVAAADALDLLLAERELKKRQDAQDVRAQESHQDAMEQRKFDREQRKKAAEHVDTDRAAKLAEDTAKKYLPGDIPDADAVSIMQKHPPTAALLRVAPSGAFVMGPPPDPTAMDDSGQVPIEGAPVQGSVVRFGGDPTQRTNDRQAEAAKAFAASLAGDASTEQAVSQYLAAGGDPREIAPLITSLRGPTGGRVTTGSFEDYVLRWETENKRKANSQEIEQLRKKYQQADDRPYAPLLYGTAEGLAVVDRESRVARPIANSDTGTQTQPQATSSQRDSERSLGRVQGFVDEIMELSPRINNKPGMDAVFAGGWRMVKAKAREDDDVATYTAMIEAFTPLFARAVGHVGVLTEADFEHSMAILPNPMDSESLAQRKIDIINRLLVAPPRRVGAVVNESLAQAHAASLKMQQDAGGIPAPAGRGAAPGGPPLRSNAPAAPAASGSAFERMQQRRRQQGR